MTPFEIVPSIASVLDRYDGFLIDQWGVMHNGIESMEHANECVDLLAKANKKMVIVSNSPGDEHGTLKALHKMGFDPQHFVGGAVTSGMLATEYIRETYPKSRALVFGWLNPAAPSVEPFLERCGDLELVDWNKLREEEMEKPFADVLILQGNEAILGPMVDGERSSTSMGDFVFSGKMSDVIDPVLKKCAQQKIPLLCVDPDFICVNPDGSQLYMPGTVARRYEELGGSCVYFGKPHSACFQEGVQRLMKEGVSDTSRIAMIGDSLHHDVKGANSIGLDSILVLGGVHRKDLGHDFGSMASRGDLQALFKNVAQTPTIVAPLLKI